MQNPYNQYQNNQGRKPKPKLKIKNQAFGKKAKPPVSKNEVKTQQSLPVGWIIGSLAGLALSFYAFAYTDDFIKILSRVQVGLSYSSAAEGEDSAAEEEEKGAENGQLPAGEISELKSDGEQLTMKNANVYQALKDKRRELEKKERRLAQLEEELQKQKVEIERQLKEMQEMRQNISAKLDRKVAADQESVDKLVGVYASMKPKNAAVILESLDEDLAVKVLGKMKKQSAAAILDFVEPKKAQTLSEKFTGLKQ